MTEGDWALCACLLWVFFSFNGVYNNRLYIIVRLGSQPTFRSPKCWSVIFYYEASNWGVSPSWLPDWLSLTKWPQWFVQYKHKHKLQTESLNTSGKCLLGSQRNLGMLWGFFFKHRSRPLLSIRKNADWRPLTFSDTWTMSIFYTA